MVLDLRLRVSPEFKHIVMQNHPLLRQQFPLIQGMGSSLIYFDNGATTQKPEEVLQCMQDFYLHNNTNVHRSSHTLAATTTGLYEKARHTMAAFINARSEKEIIWTSGCTDSINLLATILGKSYFEPGQEILVSELEHHGNIVPWQELARDKGLHLRVIPVDSQGVLDVKQGLAFINPNTALLAISHVSNALGNINPIQPLLDKANHFNSITLVDGAQAVAHLEVDVQALGCDFYGFSGHKMYGPTGIGVLYGKQSWLEKLPPYQYGGEMVKTVSFARTEYQPLPFKFEAGTPNIQGVLGLAAAVRFIQSLPRQPLHDHEQKLRQQIIQGLKQLKSVTLWGDLDKGISTVSFTVEGINHYDLTAYLDKKHIALRTGHHCAMPLMEALGIDGTIRVSLACYNNEKEVGIFLQQLTEGIVQLTDNAEKLGSVGSADGLYPLAQNLTDIRGWDETYRQVMLIARSLPKADVSLRQDAWAIHGCESPVWLRCSGDLHQIRIEADSASKIIRGLLTLLIERVQGSTAQQILAFNSQEYLSVLGLGQHLSASRGNGLGTVVASIQQFAASRLTDKPG